MEKICQDEAEAERMQVLLTLQVKLIVFSATCSLNSGGGTKSASM